ncbi:hypothetical protein RINTU1_18220 [Candidatus Regiella insecticola]|uniref:Uncharacterized protein n=1 Tax=Candidatus Regiella insecticola TaxID=138073 RepID=A0A6L2ZQ18_9ENTR|nr:hypothetical protein RINTU1_18220 [Candidatus Regiella insecticola]
MIHQPKHKKKKNLHREGSALFFIRQLVKPLSFRKGSVIFDEKKEGDELPLFLFISSLDLR